MEKYLNNENFGKNIAFILISGAISYAIIKFIRQNKGNIKAIHETPLSKLGFEINN